MARSGATLCGDRACRGRETQARLRFGFGAGNPLRRSCVESAKCTQPSAECASRARNAGVIALCLRARNAGESAFWIGAWRATLCGDRAGRGREMQVRLRFGLVALHLRRKSRTKRSFWRLGASLFGGSLVRTRFGDLAFHFWRKSYETLVLETWRLTFEGSLVRNAHFGDMALHLWSWTQTWPASSANVVRERAPRSWTQKWTGCTTNVVRETALRTWTGVNAARGRYRVI